MYGKWRVLHWFHNLQDIDIKKQGGLTAYAFVQFDDITSVVSALRDMDGEHIGNNEIKVITPYFTLALCECLLCACPSVCVCQSGHVSAPVRQCVCASPSVCPCQSVCLC